MMNIFCTCTNEHPDSVGCLLGISQIYDHPRGDVVASWQNIVPTWLCADCFEQFWCEFYDLYTVSDTDEAKLTANPSHFVALAQLEGDLQ